MDLGKLKELAKKLGGVLVLDGDKPAFVVLAYDKYQKLDTGEEIPVSNASQLENFNKNGIYEDEGITVEKLNQEILALKEEIRQKEEAELLADDQTKDVMSEVENIDPLDE